MEAPLAHSLSALGLAGAGLHGRGESGWLGSVEAHAVALAELRRRERLAILRQTAGGTLGPFDAMTALDLIRWLERVSYHTWRVCHYLAVEPAPEQGEVAAASPLDE